MPDSLPQVTHLYQNHHLNAPCWERYTPRPDDVVITTSIKSGTTWMQAIVLQLIFQDLEPRSIDDFSPWLERRRSTTSADEMLSNLEAQTQRRCIKSHLALDGVPYFPQVKYIVVARDPRDVFMSLWNHYSNYTEEQYDNVNNTPGRVGDPCPRCPSDIREFWQGWITRGWFGWESEGYPFWGNMHHIQTWWDYRHLPNILMVHYNDLLNDLPGEIQRVAEFLDISLSHDMRTAITDLVRFDSMKQNAEKFVAGAEHSFKGGPQTFINKGTNGRWRDVLTEDDLKLYDAAVASELTPDCAQWLEHGRLSE
ncbi:MAG: sulfotransferase domain-containing protein [Chloroflexota bacterium]